MAAGLPTATTSAEAAKDHKMEKMAFLSNPKIQKELLKEFRCS